MSVVYSVPAGRAVRRGDTNWVDPLPEKGQIELRVEDQQFTQFYWRSREGNSVHDELYLFPGDAEFSKVEQDTTGRTHVLKLGSGEVYFYWFQRQSTDTDRLASTNVHGVLQDPGFQILSTLPASSAPVESTTATQTIEAGPSSSIQPPAGDPAPATGGGQVDREAMARMLVEWASQGGLGSTQEDAHLTDLLSSQNVSNLLDAHPALLKTLPGLLPSELELPASPTKQDLLPILTAPQFHDAIASLDNALRSGGLPASMMTELGLPESAGRGVKEFIDGLKGLKKDGSGAAGESQGGASDSSAGGDSMETD